MASTGCSFSLVSPRKVLSVEQVPPNSEKMAKFTGSANTLEIAGFWKKQFIFVGEAGGHKAAWKYTKSCMLKQMLVRDQREGAEKREYRIHTVSHCLLFVVVYRLSLFVLVCRLSLFVVVCSLLLFVTCRCLLFVVVGRLSLFVVYCCRRLLLFVVCRICLIALMVHKCHLLS